MAVCLRARGIWRTTSLNGFALGYRKKSYCTSRNNTLHVVFVEWKIAKGLTGKPNIRLHGEPVSPMHVRSKPSIRRRSINLFAEFRHCACGYNIRLVPVLSAGIVYHRTTDRRRAMKRVLSVGGRGERGGYTFRFYIYDTGDRQDNDGQRQCRTGGKKPISIHCRFCLFTRWVTSVIVASNRRDASRGCWDGTFAPPPTGGRRLGCRR